MKDSEKTNHSDSVKSINSNNAILIFSFNVLIGQLVISKDK
jgi:hypothetical protein